MQKLLRLCIPGTEPMVDPMNPFDSADLDALVIGAGAAGLACAQDLVRAGWSVRVVEAGDEPGGRMRTDRRGGFVLDRGFQVLNPAYPQLSGRVRLDALGLENLRRGFSLCDHGTQRRFTDPLAGLDFWRQLLSGRLGGVADLASFGRYTAGTVLSGARRIKSGADVPARQALRESGCSAQFVDRVVRPFFAGVFLDESLETSNRVLRLVWRSMLRGSGAVPAGGIGAVAKQMADALPAGTVSYECPAREVTGEGAVLADGREISARKVIVATDPGAARALIPGLPEVATNAVTTFYHATSRAPVRGRQLLVDAEPKVLNTDVLNTLVISNVQPGFAPPGYALVSTSVAGAFTSAEPDVRRRLGELYDTDTTAWELVARYDIPMALPRMTPPWPLTRSTRVGPGRYVCGDYRATGSVQGAMASGARAAREAIADANQTRPPASP